MHGVTHDALSNTAGQTMQLFDPMKMWKQDRRYILFSLLERKS